MALAAGKQLQPQSPTLPLDDLGDMAWLGSLVEPGPPAASPPSRMSPSSLQPATASAAAPPPAQSAAAMGPPVPSSSSPAASYPTDIRPDVRRRTSSGPAATMASVPPGPMPRGPNTSLSAASSPPQPIKQSEQRPYPPQQQQQQQPALSPSSLSPTDSRPGGFFSAFRRTSSSQLSPVATSFGGGGGGRLSPTAGTGSYVPVIKDEHALHRRQSLAKQLLGPSSSNQGPGLRRTSASHEQMSITREEVEAGDEKYDPRRRHVTADGPVGSVRHGYSDSSGSRSTAASTSSYGQYPQQPAHYASAPRQRAVSSSPSIPEYASEPGWGPLAGGRVVRIDGRLFRFDRSGDRLELVPDLTPSTDGSYGSRPHSSASSAPSAHLPRREPSPRRPETEQTSRAPTDSLTAAGAPRPEPSLQPTTSGKSPTLSADSGSSERFHGDAINNHYSALGVGLPLRQDFARPPAVASAAAGAGSDAPLSTPSGRPLSQPTLAPIESPLTAVSESLSMAEVEFVQNAVHGVAREQGHVVQFQVAPSAAAGKTDEMDADGVGDGPTPPAERPSFETKGSGQSGRTVVSRPTRAPPLPPAVPARPAGLPFEGRVGSPHQSHPAVGSHSVRTIASSSQRPVPAPLVIPSATSADERLHPRDQAAARLASGGRRQDDGPDETVDDVDDDRPLAHRLAKLQQRDSSPAVLSSPVLGGPSEAGSDNERRQAQQQQQARPQLAVDQPPPLPAKSQSFSIPASRTYQQHQQQQQQQHYQQQQEYQHRQQQQQRQQSPSYPTAGWPSSGHNAHQQPSAEGAPRDPYEVLSRPMPKELDTSAQMKEKLMRSMTGFGKARKSAKSKMEQVVDAARHQLAAGSPSTASPLGVPKSTSTPAHHHHHHHPHAAGSAHANPYANPHAQPHAHSHSRSVATGSSAGTAGGSTLASASVAASASLAADSSVAAAATPADPAPASASAGSRMALPPPPQAPPLMTAPARHDVPLVPAPAAAVARPASPKRSALSPVVHTSDSLARRMAEVEDEEERRLAENVFM